MKFCEISKKDLWTVNIMQFHIIEQEDKNEYILCADCKRLFKNKTVNIAEFESLEEVNRYKNFIDNLLPCDFLTIHELRKFIASLYVTYNWYTKYNKEFKNEKGTIDK